MHCLSNLDVDPHVCLQDTLPGVPRILGKLLVDIVYAIGKWDSQVIVL